MDKDEKNLELDKEQNADEQAIMQEVHEDDLRSELADELGLNPDSEEDSGLLDKFVTREKKSRDIASGAIKQKIKWRQRAESKFDKEPDKGGKDAKVNLDDKVSVEDKIRQEFEERDLKALDLPDEVEEQVKTLAKLKKISVREAAEDPIIVSLSANFEKEQRIKNATPTRSKRGSSVSTYDASATPNPDNFDFNSMEGVKAWREAKRKHREHKQNNS